MKNIDIELHYEIQFTGLCILGYEIIPLAIESDQYQVDAEIDSVNKSIQLSVINYSVSEDFIKNLAVHDNVQYYELDGSVMEEIANILERFSGVANRIVEFIKYQNGVYNIAEELTSLKRAGFKVLTQERELHYNIPQKGSILNERSQFFMLNLTEREMYQTAISGKLMLVPFKAMKFLHNSKNEQRLPYKWIDATVAAELAVKEAISRKSEDARKLLLDLPSPPLTKLYGSVLEKFFGVASPYKNKLKDGMEIRNKLVHSPETTVIDHEESIKYVTNVELAILHLMTLVYPDNYFCRRNYEALRDNKEIPR